MEIIQDLKDYIIVLLGGHIRSSICDEKWADALQAQINAHSDMLGGILEYPANTHPVVLTKGRKTMKRSKKLKRKLESRIRDWQNTVGAKDAKAYRKPGSNK